MQGSKCRAGLFTLWRGDKKESVLSLSLDASMCRCVPNVCHLCVLYTFDSGGKGEPALSLAVVLNPTG